MIIGCLLLAFAGLSCKPQPQISKVSVTDSDDKIQKDGILFLTFDIFRADDTYKVELIEEKIVPGKVREKSNSRLRNRKHLKIEFRDDQSRLISEMLVRDPLDQVMESFNEDGSISQVPLQLDSSSFVVRINYTQNLGTVSVYKGEKTTTFEELASFNLSKQ
jgi:hypothetical protein